MVVGSKCAVGVRHHGALWTGGVLDAMAHLHHGLTSGDVLDAMAHLHHLPRVSYMCIMC